MAVQKAPTSVTEGKLPRTRKPAAEKPSTVANTTKRRERVTMAPARPKPAASTTTTKKAPPKKTAAAKAPTKKATETKAVASNMSKKRKAEDDADVEKPVKKATTTKTAAQEPAPKKEPVKKPATKKTAAATRKPVKALQKGTVINEPPTEVVEVLVFGEGSAGELGLGTAKNAVDVKRPRVNANLEKVGVVQISAGGMHAVALTSDNKILTWGVNDTSALGRNTDWDGGLRDMDADEEGSDDEDSGLNPQEATPAEIDLSTTSLAEGTRWTKVAGGDSCTLALTDDGKVYGWGTFRCNEGAFGFTPEVGTAKRPMLISGLKNIIDIACGANHALALDNKGVVFAWGAGEQNQLGRRVVERNKREGLNPREVGMPRQAKRKIKKIESGPYHCFAITNDDEVYSWGLNAFGQTGVTMDSAGEDGAIVGTAQLIKSLAGKKIVSIAGGSHHTIAATADGECLTWGRVDGGQTGIPQSELAELGDTVIKNERGQLALLTVPSTVRLVKGQASVVSAGPENSLVITKEGKAYSCGFSANYQTGLGTSDDVLEMTLIDNTATKDRFITSATAGGQYSIITAKPKA